MGYLIGILFFIALLSIGQAIYKCNKHGHIVGMNIGYNVCKCRRCGGFFILQS